MSKHGYPMRLPDAAPGVERWLIRDKSILTSVHSGVDCVPPCVLHSPTDHHLRHLPLLFRFDRGIFERICEHGVGHPDPDTRSGPVGSPSDGIHGCDGCCGRVESTQPVLDLGEA